MIKTKTAAAAFALAILMGAPAFAADTSINAGVKANGTPAKIESSNSVKADAAPSTPILAPVATDNAAQVKTDTVAAPQDGMKKQDMHGKKMVKHEKTDKVAKDGSKVESSATTTVTQ